jgi:hypothetical protein
MTTQSASENNTVRRPAGKLIAGTILVLAGAFALLGQFVSFNPGFFPLWLGAIFLAAGIITRNTGLLVPGGILSGIAAGSMLVIGPYDASPDPLQGGMFLLAFAGGWALISLLSPITNPGHKVSLWPLVPGGILALIGAALVVDGPALKALEIVGQGWPLVLIAVGLYIMLRRK